MEGLIPLSEYEDIHAEEIKGKDFYIGLDSAITLANPTTVVVAILIVRLLCWLPSSHSTVFCLVLTWLPVLTTFVCSLSSTKAI